MLRRGHLLVVISFVVGLCLNGTAQTKVSPVGCFQNLQEVQGDIFGFGVMIISKTRSGSYRGSFSERRTELGEHYEAPHSAISDTIKKNTF